MFSIRYLALFVFIFCSFFGVTQAQITSKRDIRVSAEGISSVGFRLNFSDERTDNPSIFSNVYAGNHTVYSRYQSGYDISVGMCSYKPLDPECIVTSFATASCDINFGLCSYSFSNVNNPSTSDWINKVVWRYSVPTAPTGDIFIKRVGSDLYASSAPAGSASAVGAGSFIQTNPNIWQNLSTGDYTVYTTYSSIHNVSFGRCTYTRGSQECTVSSFTNLFTGLGDGRCDSATGRCRVDLNGSSENVGANRVTKVVFKYDPVSSVSLSCQANFSETTIGTSVTWSIFTNLSGTITRSWSGDEGLTGTGATVVKAYTTLGLKNASVQITSSGNVYTANCTPINIVSSINNQSAQVSIKEELVNPQYNFAKINTENSSDVSRPITFATSTGSQVVYFPSIPNLTLTPLVCVYPIGSICNNLIPLTTPAIVNNLYKISYNTTAGNVTEFVTRYVSSSNTYNLQIERIGTDQTPATAPNGFVRINSSTSIDITINPLIIATSSSNVVVYTPKVPGYNIERGTCSGVSSCFITSYASTTTNCDANLCWINIGAISSAYNFARASFRYVPTGTQAQTGAPQILTKRVGEDLYASSAPANSQSGVNDSTMISDNPYFWTNLTTGTQSVFTTYLPNYAISAGTCAYNIGAPECAVTTFQNLSLNNTLDNFRCNTFNNKCRFDVTTSNNQIRKVVFRYIPSITQNNPNPTTNSGDVIIYRTGNNFSTDTVPSGTIAQLNNFTSDSGNPSTYFNIPNASSISNYVYANKLSGIGMDISYCQYDRNQSDCTNLDLGTAHTSCDLSWCARGIPVYTDKVTKVFVRYYVGPEGTEQIVQNPSSAGTVSIETVGYDQTIATAPSTSIRINSPENIVTNNTSYTFSTTTTLIGGSFQRVYVAKPAGYDLQVASCLYDINTTPCISAFTGSYFSYTQADTNGRCDVNNICRWDVSVGTNQVSRVIWRLVPVGQSIIKVDHVGIDGSKASAPAGVASGLKLSTVDNFQNPASYSTTTAGYSTYIPIYIKRISGYVVQAGTCDYGMGEIECDSLGSYGSQAGVTVTTLSDTTGSVPSNSCSTTTNICMFRSGWGGSLSGRVLRTVFRYVPENTEGPDGTAHIKVYRIGALGSTQVSLYRSDGTNSISSDNPITFKNLTQNIHSLFTTLLPNSNPKLQICWYNQGDPECATRDVSSLNQFGAYPNACDSVLGLCGVAVTPKINEVFKAEWVYENQNQTGSVMLKRVGSDLYASSAPSNTRMGLNTTSLITTNPNTYTNVQIGTSNNTVYATYLSGQYITSFGNCTYAIGTSECAVTNFSPLAEGIGDGQCDKNLGICKKTYPVTSGMVTKVVAKYDATVSNLYFITANDVVVEKNQIKTHTISINRRTGAPVTNVNLSISGLSSSINTSLTPTSCNTTCQITLNINPGNTPVGKYTAVVLGNPDEITTSFVIEVVEPEPEEEDFSLSCSANQTTGVVGKEVVWTANVSPAGDYSYNWSESGCIAQTCKVVYGSTGNKNINLTVSNEQTSKSCTGTIQIGVSRFFEF